MIEIRTDLTPTHFIPWTACQRKWDAYLDAAAKLSVNVLLQPYKDADMGDLIEITLPSVQIWPYGEAPSWARIYDDDADWAIFIPDHIESQIDIDMHLSSLANSDFYGPVNVPGGEVWTAHHA